MISSTYAGQARADWISSALISGTAALCSMQTVSRRPRSGASHGRIATDAIILITYILIILLAAFILWMIIDVRNNVKRIADSLDRLASSESRRNGEAHHQSPVN